MLVIAAGLAAGCGRAGSAVVTTAPGRPPVTTTPPPPPRDVPAIVRDLNAYWAVHDEELGFRYRPVPPRRVGTLRDGLTCDGAPIDRADVAGNAYVDPDCSEGILVAYDPRYVEATTVRAEATMAHEWGHVIQAQADDIDLSRDPDGLPIDAELQADCFAGAWAAERARSPIGRLRTDTARSGDPSGTDVEDPDAHGLPRERVTAFDVGLHGGPVACVDELIDALP
ncbi:MAG: hypothetical protein U0237_17170 [Thermoleophilia bacterium]